MLHAIGGCLRLLQIALGLMALLMGAAAHAEPSGELIFQPGTVPFASSHASTIVELKNGDLLAAWFGGTAEGKPDVAIWSARRTSGAWSAPVELAREPSVPCWNPVLFHTGEGRLWLYYKFGPSPETWVAARKYSFDEGQTWSAAEHLPAGLLGPIRAKPLVLRDGTIVAGSSIEAYQSWAAWIERSTDGGKTWAKIGPIVPQRSGYGAEAPQQTTGSTQTPPAAALPPANFGIIQPSVVQLGDKHLRFYARSTQNIGRVMTSDSTDDGVTWSAPKPLDVPNPNSGIDSVVLQDGRVVLIYNNTTTGRTPLNLAVSTDGQHFRMFYTLEDQPGEYSYPAMIQVKGGDLEITYTWQRKSIRHVHFPLADVPK
jgi:predicted neuraminidase